MTSHSARAFWITEPGQAEIRAVSVVPPGDGEIEIETLYSAVSRGTESLVFAGRVPLAEYQRMRAPFQDGEFPGPVKYGYTSVGRVLGGSAELTGQQVFCLYPHQTRYVVPATAVTIIPDDVPAARAVLAANLETAVNAIWDGAPMTGDRIAVIGAGTVGCLTAWLAAGLRGAEVELIDIDPGKARFAEQLGIAFREPDAAGREADLVFEASGSEAGLNLALELAGFEARIVELSWFGTGKVAAAFGQAFHSKRLRLISSQVAHIANRQRSRWTHARRMQLVMRLLADQRLDVLITGESPFDTLPDLLPRLAASGQGTLCHRIAYR
jgi:2-desacetyl-2-hydroxyethyl bacteriochlorophyllide A dehydrogenase